ncbi:PspA/IM30 family protein [Robertmurraya korlensis]|jgi:phage shock protein A|uniref:PspA/IM30 family protein n=1 Tax=Robertmurraya korlensis TaxID=519977 RepID=UPI00082466A7|nr:PspA/IM30 family protein [Robertmurraya korlensis]
MGIFKRIKDIATADVNDALDRLEDPISMLKQYLRELEGEIGKAQKALAQQLYIEKKFEAVIESTIDRVQKRARQAELAVERGEDQIARLAIEDKLQQEKKLRLYEGQYHTIKNQTNLLYDELDKLKEKYDELQDRKLLLVSRMTAAKVTNDISQVLSSINPDRAVKGFIKVEEEILKLEAKSQANQYFTKANVGRIESVLGTYSHEDVERELEKLKSSRLETV